MLNSFMVDCVFLISVIGFWLCVFILDMVFVKNCFSNNRLRLVVGGCCEFWLVSFI